MPSASSGSNATLQILIDCASFVCEFALTYELFQFKGAFPGSPPYDTSGELCLAGISSEGRSHNAPSVA